MIYKQKSFILLRITFDLILLNISFLVSAIIAQSWQILLDRSYIFVLMMALNIIWYFSSSAFGFYEDAASRNFPSQFVNILKNSSIQAVSSIIFIFIVKEDLFTRNFIVYHFILLTVFISLRTIVYRRTLNYLRKKGKSLINLLIIGTGNLGTEFSNLISDEPELSYKFAGFVDDQPPTDDSGLYLGRIDELENILEEQKIEEVIIALSNPAAVLLERIINICNKAGLRIHIIPDFTKFLSKKFRIGLIGNFPLITMRNEPLEEIQWRFLKRTFDIFISTFIIIIILSWLIPLLMIFQKIISGGKIFFIQERIGKNNKKFRCYKFRTIEEIRVTKFGSFLRKNSLDELPQFFNVLIGNMSIVGPRPHAIEFNETYKEFIDYIKLRNLVKPGITGWAQVHGLRGDVEDEILNRIRTKKRIEFDIWYIENWSFWLDVQIFMITIWQMIRGKNKGQ
jgi:putative colanic acid biosynthesis UDP-glucose lipid carrier transferase